MPQSNGEISSVFLSQKINEKLFSYVERISFIPNSILTLNVEGSFIAKLANLFPRSEIKKITMDELKSAHFSVADESLDLIVANTTIIIDLDLNRFFLDARRILKKTGLFIFSTYDSSSKLMIEKYIEKTKQQLILDDKQVKKDLDKLYSLSYSSHEEQIKLSAGKLAVNIDIFTVAHVDVPQEVDLLKRVNIEAAERGEIKNQENKETSENEEKKKEEIEPEMEEAEQEEESEREDKDKPEEKEEVENREIQEEKKDEVEKDIPEKPEKAEENEHIEEESLEIKDENIEGLEKEVNVEENEHVEENERENKEESVEAYENKEIIEEKEGALEPEEGPEEEGEEEKEETEQAEEENKEQDEVPEEEEKKEKEENEREKDEEELRPEENQGEPEEFAHLENEMDESKDRLTEYAEKLAQHLDSSAKIMKFLSGPQLNIKEKEKKLAELQARNIEHKKMLETYQNLHTQHRSLLNTFILSQEKVLKSNPNLRDQYHKLVADHSALLDKHNENIKEHQLFLKPRPFNMDT